jgi:acetate---CoA ligase (ADP-forming)
MKLEKFLNPKFIAVIGASSDKAKVGRRVFDNVISTKKKGVFPINLKENNIAGYKAYSDVSNIPLKKWSELLVVIVIPAKGVVSEVQKCAKLGVKNIIIISAGFKEVGELGAKMEEEIRAISQKNKMNILGPNCLGFINDKNYLNVTFSNYNIDKKIKRNNNIAFLSQSGAIGSAVLDWINDKNIGLSYFVSLGNKVSLEENDFLKFLSQDKKTDLIIAYLEEISCGPEFLKIISQLSKTKPVAILKSGRTSSGQEMALSHTGSLAGSFEITLVALKRAGAIILENIDEIYNLMNLIKSPAKDFSGGLAIVSNAGGPAVLSADEASENGLDLASFSPVTTSKLKKILPEFAHLKNPLDILGDADPIRYEKALNIILADKNISSALVLLTPQSMTEVEKTAEAICRVKAKFKNKLITTCFLGGAEVSKGKKILTQYFVPNFDSLEDTIGILAKFLNYIAQRKKIKEFFPDKNIEIKDQKTTGAVMWHYLDSFAFLKKGQIDVVSCQELTPEKLEKIKYPIVIKFTGPDFIHKSDNRAVFLNVSTKDEVERIMEIFNKKIMQKKISSANTIIFQAQLDIKRELILGLKRDPVFGPIILLGAGGIYAEIYSDVVLELADLDRARALEMIKKLKFYPILMGARGQKKANIKLLIETILKFAKLIKSNQDISEIDINPLLIDDKKVIAVDVRIFNY